MTEQEFCKSNRNLLNGIEIFRVSSESQKWKLEEIQNLELLAYRNFFSSEEAHMFFVQSKIPFLVRSLESS